MLQKTRHILDLVIGSLSGVFFVIAVCATLIGIMDRTFGLNWKAVWAEELTRYSIIWSMFLIVGMCLRLGYQTSFTLFLEKMPDQIRRLVQLVVYLLITLLFLLLLFYGTKSALLNFGQRSPVLQVPMFFPYMAIPVGALLGLFETVTGMYEMIKTPSRESIQEVL